MSWLKKIFSSQSSQGNQSVLRSGKRQKRRRETTSDRISYGKTGQAYLKDYFENYIDISIGIM